MAKKIGKKRRRRKRLALPGSYLIVTEGTKTEVNYFRHLADKLSKHYEGLADRIDVVVPSLQIEGAGVSNFSLIDYVDKLRQSAPNLYENVWLVFDKDDIPVDYFDNAIKAAEQQKWHVAWSNDSFELWYLLHFEYLTAAIDRGEYKAKLSGYLKAVGVKEGYAKNAESIFPLLDANQQKAIRFGHKLEDSNAGKPYHEQNPMTTVFKLVEELQELADWADQQREKLEQQD